MNVDRSKYDEAYATVKHVKGIEDIILKIEERKR
jgi:hypothetical protein